MRTATRVFILLLVAAAVGYWLGQRLDEPPLEAPALLPARAETEPEATFAAAVDAQPAELSRDERNSVTVYQQASPAVVNVTTRTLEMSFFYGAVPVEGSGSGFILNEDGLIATNYHVVANAEEIQVTLSDRSSYEASLVGADPLTDLAVVKIDPEDKDLPTLPLGDSDNLQVGQKVLAIGNPFGFQGTLTTGIISALERSIPTESGALLEGAIQTDAAINRGNSGGPLLDSAGRVIGVNTLIISPSGGSVGIGFAVPVNTLKFVLDDLVRYGRVQRPWLGINAFQVWPRLARALDLPAQEGLLIASVERGGPAEDAGLRGGSRRVRVGRYLLVLGGDLIVAIDGQGVASLNDINRVIYKKRPGDTVTVEYYRGSRKRTVRLTLEARPGQGRRARRF